MILKKPFAFFIKIFKPLHLLMSFLLGYLLYLSDNIIKFLNEYIYSSLNVIDKSIIEKLINNNIYIIPIILIILFIIVLSVMFKKNKPITFYFVGIFCFIFVLVINIYTANFFNILSENIVSIKTVKLIHDLILINMIVLSFLFVFLFTRGIGINFKKIDFTSDALKLDINESDNEEVEFNVDIDFDEKRRKRKEKLRNLKYFYVENKFILNIVIISILLVSLGATIYFVIKSNEKNEEGIYYNYKNFSLKVNDTMIVNKDYMGNKITNDYLIVVNTNIKSIYDSNSLRLNDFSLTIDDIKFKPVKKYFDSLLDLGNFYDEKILPTEYTDYLFVFEIPKKYIKDEMYFSYNSEGNVIDVYLNPKELLNNEVTENKKITENLKFEGALNNVEFKINEFTLSDKFLIEYDYCINEDNCYKSKEYLRPSLDENYDKTILKLYIEYNSASNLDVNNFYKLLSKFGTLEYKIGNKWYTIYKFEEIKSKKVNSKTDVYVGVNSNVLNAESIKLVFNVRGLKYEYLLK